MEEVDINAPSAELLGQTPPPEAVSTAAPVPSTSPQPQSAPVFDQQAKTTYTPEHKSHIAPLRTFSSDLAQAVREKGGSVVRIAIAEEEKHRHEYEESSITSKKNIFFILGGVILVLGAIGTVFFEYQYKKNASVEAPTTVLAPSSIVHTESSATLDISGKQLADVYASIAAIVATNDLQTGTMKNIVITQTTSGTAVRIPASQFFTTLNTHAPADFLRSLAPDYMIGVYNYDKNNAFIILHGTAHDFLLAGMLGWEPNLLADITPLLNVDLTNMASASTAFTGTVIGNLDARALFDSTNKPVLFYSFLDDNTVFIGTDPKTLSEVVRRFQP